MWLAKCPSNGMEWFTRFTSYSAAGLLSFFVTCAAAHDVTLAGVTSGESLAFARYIASLRQPDPFTQAGTVVVTIEAWSPSLHLESRILMLRRPDTSGHSEYLVVDKDGELGATLDLILPYIEEEQHLQEVSQSSRVITPANYKFHYLGMMETEDVPVYVFDVSPRQKLDGLMRGELWIDSETGRATARTGYLVKKPSALIRRMEISQDTKFIDGLPVLRISHVVIETRHTRHGLLTIVERPLRADDSKPSEPSMLGPSDLVARSHCELVNARTGRLEPCPRNINSVASTK